MQVKDLLAKDNPKGGLPVRQNPKQGFFYVQGLKKVPVGSYIEIEKRMEQGKRKLVIVMYKALFDRDIYSRCFFAVRNVA